MKHPRSPRPPALARASGFTLVEMMVAMAIGMIVLLGLSVTFVNLKSTFNSQDKFAQLQDNERLALSMLTTTLNEAGYYPNSWSSDRTQIQSTTDAIGGSMPQSRIIYGVAASGGNPESMSTAYASASGDGLLSCQGGTNTSGSTTTVRNTFYVAVDTSTGISSLGCAVENNAGVVSAWTPIISNVQSMSVLYGVDSDGDNLVDQYMGPTAVNTALLWDSVKSARITLVFTNPYSSTPITWVQTINLMNNR